jgi:hypothetical protein
MRLMLRLKLMGGCWGRQMQNDERAAACWVCYVCDDFGGNEGAVVFQAVGEEATLGRSESCHCEPQRNSCGHGMWLHMAMECATYAYSHAEGCLLCCCMSC